MHRSLDYPLLTAKKFQVEDEVVAALQAEVVWLCRSGELDQLYRAYPCFMSRTQALQNLLKRYRMDALAKKFPGRTCHYVVACHDHAVSLVLQVMDKSGKPTPAADEMVSIRLREGLAPDGRPLPDMAQLS